MRYEKDVSDNEALYIQLQRLYTPLTIQLVVEGEGTIEKELLQKAVGEASAACPLSRAIFSNGKWVDTLICPPVREITDYPFDGYHFENLSLLEEPLDPENGPTSEVVLLQKNPMVLLFRIFHGTMDGKGAMLWIYNIFRALNNAPLVTVNSIETDLSFIKKRPHKNQKNPLSLDVKTSLKRCWNKKTKIWRQRITFFENPSCVVSKIAEIITKQSASFQNRFLIPVDLRRHDSNLISNSNLTLPIFLKTTKDQDWTNIHQNLIEALQDNEELNLSSADLKLARIPSFFLKSAFKSLDVLQWMMNRHLVGGIISNLGKVDLEALSTKQFSAKTLYSMAIQQPFSPFTVAIASNALSTEIMLSCYESDPHVKIAKNIVSEIQKKLSSAHFLSRYNDTYKEYPQDETVVHLIEKQILKTPNAVAIEIQKKSLSYQELGCQIDKIASLLLEKNIRPNDPVAVLMPRSLLLMPALLAILKIGAFYIPIDIDLPYEKIENLLKNGQAVICLTEQNLIEKFYFLKNKPLLILNQEMAPGTCVNLAKPLEIAYQMYTSGSTGAPKGVQIQHKSLINYLLWAKKSYKVDEKSRFPLFASVGFDSTITSMFLPLIAGASIEIFEDQDPLFVLRHIVESLKITHIKLSPAHLQLIAQMKCPQDNPKTVIIGGEQLHIKLCKTVSDLYLDWTLINEYGPTEATVGCITYTYKPNIPLSGIAVPIGTPIMNTQVFLLDDKLSPAAFGKIGEIYLGGDCLARGYAQEISLDKEKFMTLEKYGRVYKTGDLAYFNKEGDLVFKGRNDTQIKICGHRIELGEIESVLLEYPGIIETAVVAKKSSTGRDRLAAFYTSDAVVDKKLLQEHIQKKLPAYMQVHQLSELDKMPLTPHQKIDRKALIEKYNDFTPLSPHQNNNLQGGLAAIWREVLELDKDYPVSMDDNFYQLGGDSLSMLILVHDVSKKLLGESREALLMQNLNEFVKTPTIKTLSKIIEM